MTFELLSVNEQVAKKLKEHGFNVPCIARFYKRQYRMNFLGDLYDHNSGIINKDYVSAPLIMQVRQWLVEKYGLDYNIHLDFNYTDDIKGYWEDINNTIMKTLNSISL